MDVAFATGGHERRLPKGPGRQGLRGSLIFFIICSLVLSHSAGFGP